MAQTPAPPKPPAAKPGAAAAEEDKASAAIPPPPPILSRGGILGMATVLILELLAVVAVVKWMYSADTGAPERASADADRTRLDLGDVRSRLQGPRGIRDFAAQIVLQINPLLSDPAAGRSLLERGAPKVSAEVQAAIREEGERLAAKDPTALGRLGTRIRERLNRAFPMGASVGGLVSEVSVQEH